MDLTIIIGEDAAVTRAKMRHNNMLRLPIGTVVEAYDRITPHSLRHDESSENLERPKAQFVTTAAAFRGDTSSFIPCMKMEDGWPVAGRIDVSCYDIVKVISFGATEYNVFTTKFDEVVFASELCAPDELDEYRKLLDNHLAAMVDKKLIPRLASRLKCRLAKQDGNTAVTLLVDNSGSMRGRPITIAAISTDIIARILKRAGIKTEILGFTTKSWKGGDARRHWEAIGKPQNPGRLAELRHIIYTDNDWCKTHRNISLMLREGLPKENVDGEALQWAYGRLVEREEKNRILMIMTDGHPVDDSTISVNLRNFLENHLQQVIGGIESESLVKLCAIGIDHDASKYYRRFVNITGIASNSGREQNKGIQVDWNTFKAGEQLGEIIVKKLAELISEK